MTETVNPNQNSYHLTHLKELEAESIFVIREVAAQFERPALLFSGGKDSIILSHLARKAFWPGRIPFPLLHIDTGHNFPEAHRIPGPLGGDARREADRPLRPGLRSTRAGPWRRRATTPAGTCSRR